MSDKQASFHLEGWEEDTDKSMGMSVVVDFLNPGYVYLSMGVDDGSERCSAMAIADPAARELAQFILRETRA